MAAAVMADAIVRIIPGVISDEQSALLILSRIIYWRYLFILVRQNIRWKVPRFCFQGTKRRCKEWELQQSLERTRDRPDLLED